VIPTLLRSSGFDGTADLGSRRLRFVGPVHFYRGIPPPCNHYERSGTVQTCKPLQDVVQRKSFWQVYRNRGYFFREICDADPSSSASGMHLYRVIFGDELALQYAVTTTDGPHTVGADDLRRRHGNHDPASHAVRQQAAEDRYHRRDRLHRLERAVAPLLLRVGAATSRSSSTSSRCGSATCCCSRCTRCSSRCSGGCGTSTDARQPRTTQSDPRRRDRDPLR